MTNWIGYLALALSITAIANKDIFKLRAFHAFASVGYIVYGFLLVEMPLMIGGAIFLCINCYHLMALLRNKKNLTNE
ncbi:MAG: hypothetical protein JXR10_13640 [Cyclobacteriaceae bacterium]